MAIILSRRGLATLLAGIGVGLASARGADMPPMAAPIAALDAALVEAMKAGRDKPFRERYTSLAPAIENAFDLPVILQVSVGPRWATLPPAMQAQLLHVFRRFTIASYVANFDSYDGQKFEILPDTRKLGDDEVVETRMVAGNGNAIRLDYVMRGEDGAWKATDVLMDGSISRVAVQRSDFRGLLGQGGAADLIASLQRKVTDLSGGAIELVIAWLPAALAVVGLAQAVAGWRLVSSWSANADRQRLAAGDAITVLKPLHGAEPLLEEALASLCVQDHRDYQIVFGVQDAADPAAAVVHRLQARFPSCDIALVIDPRQHGANGKVGNLINMLPAARHDVLAIADSDLHVRPDYVTRLLAALAEPGTGLVTTLYAGLPATDCLAARLGATQITHSFLPGALLARALGRQDGLGATMVLRRETLARIGGLAALVDHLADDNALGRLVRGLGLAVRLATTVPATTVPEATLRALVRHELRWARTIRALAPAPFAASVLQYPLVWAALAVLLSAGAAWAWALFAAAWAIRAGLARGIDRSLAPLLPGVAFPAPVWLLPLRELMSVLVLAGGFTGSRVDWRGHTMNADGPVAVPQPGFALKEDLPLS